MMQKDPPHASSIRGWSWLGRIVGQYLSSTYLETKRRPKYILREYSEI